MTRSANDAAVVIAEAIAGDEDDFAKLMTRKARALGMTKHGLSQRLRPAQRRTGHHGARSGHARPRDPGPLPALLPLFRDRRVQLSRPLDPQPQSPARQCRRRRRHQDRLYPRLRLQPRDARCAAATAIWSAWCWAAAAAVRATPPCAICSPKTSTRARPRALSPRSPNAATGGQCRDGAEGVASATTGRPRTRAGLAAAEPSLARMPPRARLRPGQAVADGGSRRRAAGAAPKPAKVEQQAKPEPAPLTSGVIQTQPIRRDPGFGRADEAGPGQDRSGQGRTDELGLRRPSQPAPPVRPMRSRRAPRSGGDLQRRGGKRRPTQGRVAGQRSIRPRPGPKCRRSRPTMVPAMAFSACCRLPASGRPVAPQAMPLPTVSSAPAADQCQQNGAIKPAAAAARTGWIIQVGALESESEAAQRIDPARSQAARPARQGRSLHRAGRRQG